MQHWHIDMLLNTLMSMIMRTVVPFIQAVNHCIHWYNALESPSSRYPRKFGITCDIISRVSFMQPLLLARCRLSVNYHNLGAIWMTVFVSLRQPTYSACTSGVCVLSTDPVSLQVNSDCNLLERFSVDSEHNFDVEVVLTLTVATWCFDLFLYVIDT